MPSELDLIERIRARAGGLPADPGLLLGIGDDAALLHVPPGQCLAVSTDTLVAGVHYPHDTAPYDIGWKALAVNLSDLAAMGAVPRWATLNLSLPRLDLDWVDGFLDGFLDLARRQRVSLVGGDCTAAPLAVLGVTIHGLVPDGQALRRDLARAGDQLWLSGGPGEAAAGLEYALGRRPWPSAPAATVQAAALLRSRLDRPQPRVELGLALRELASAAMDVSDGLLLDLGRLARASGLAAELQLEALPVSAALQQAVGLAHGRQLLLGGGDDYELLFAAPPQRHEALCLLAERLALPLACIGQLHAGSGVRVLDGNGADVTPAQRGWQHFAP